MVLSKTVYLNQYNTKNKVYTFNYAAILCHNWDCNIKYYECSTLRN